MVRSVVALSLLLVAPACRREAPSSTTAQSPVGQAAPVATATATHDSSCEGMKAGGCDCEHGAGHEAKHGAGHAATHTTTAGKLEPWQAAAEAFTGCSGACGLHAGKDETAKVQPGAGVGERTYCPVSGAVFEITATSPQRRVGDKTLYFCCDGCVSHFNSHQHEILAARGLAP